MYVCTWLESEVGRLARVAMNFAVHPLKQPGGKEGLAPLVNYRYSEPKWVKTKFG